MLKEELLKIAKSLGITDKRLFDNIYNETILTAKKLLGNININSISNYTYISDLFMDIAMRNKENNIMANKDVLNEYINGDKSFEDMLKEYETSGDTKAKTDNAFPVKKKKDDEEELIEAEGDTSGDFKQKEIDNAYDAEKEPISNAYGDKQTMPQTSEVDIEYGADEKNKVSESSLKEGSANNVQGAIDYLASINNPVKAGNIFGDQILMSANKAFPDNRDMSHFLITLCSKLQ